jgi:hypothetical protein
MHIACLHTAASNIAVFEAAAHRLGLPPGTLRHEVRPELLEAAQHAGALTPEIVQATCAALLA